MPESVDAIPEDGGGLDMDSLSLYLDEISRYPFLPRLHEQLLFERVEKGDDAAKAALIESHLRLVVSVAKAFRNRGLPFQDLIQEGNLGLQAAVEKFDHSRGNRLSTYAVRLIASRIDRALANGGRAIRLPVSAQRKLAKIRRVERQLYQWLGREPTNRDVAEELWVPLREIEALKGQVFSTVSLSTPVGEEGEELGSLLPDDGLPAVDDRLVESEERRALREALSQLTPRRREIIELRYGLGGVEAHTLEEIAELLGVTRQRISQVELEVLDELRESLNPDE